MIVCITSHTYVGRWNKISKMVNVTDFGFKPFRFHTYTQIFYIFCYKFNAIYLHKIIIRPHSIPIPIFEFTRLVQNCFRIYMKQNDQ